MHTSDKQQPARRHFLKQSLAIGGTGVLLLLTANGEDTVTETESAMMADNSKTHPQGYRLTDHIRTYYDTARS